MYDFMACVVLCTQETEKCNLLGNYLKNASDEQKKRVLWNTYLFQELMLHENQLVKPTPAYGTRMQRLIYVSSVK